MTEKLEELKIKFNEWLYTTNKSTILIVGFIVGIVLGAIIF